MHEVALALELLEIACERAAARRVSRLVVEIGVRSCVSADALRFAFEVAAKETNAEGAVVEVRAIAARGECVVCRAERSIEDVWAACACGGEYRIEGGDELRLREIEVQ